MPCGRHDTREAIRAARSMSAVMRTAERTKRGSGEHKGCDLRVGEEKLSISVQIISLGSRHNAKTSAQNFRVEFRRDREKGLAKLVLLR